MNKQVLIQYAKDDYFWDKFVENAADKCREEDGGGVYAAIVVNEFDLSDHQFVRIKLNLNNGQELAFLIPRTMFVTIIEGKENFMKMGFGATRKGSK